MGELREGTCESGFASGCCNVSRSPAHTSIKPGGERERRRRRSAAPWEGVGRCQSGGRSQFELRATGREREREKGRVEGSSLPTGPKRGGMYWHRQVADPPSDN